MESQQKKKNESPYDLGEFKTPSIFTLKLE